MAKSKIIIIGGGASGLIAGIVAKRLGAKVTIIERKDKIGRKILATGNGRCNISNAAIKNINYHSASESDEIVNHVYKQFDLEDLQHFFHELGLDLLEKDKGKLFPITLQSSSVVDVLLYELERLKVEIIPDTTVQSIEVNGQFKVHTNQKTFYGSHLILATGGKSNPDLGSNGSGFTLAKSLGHHITPVFPSLVQLKTAASYLKSIKGTKIEGRISLYDGEEFLQAADGEILFTDYGISGPPVLDLSRMASCRYHKGLKTTAKIDILPNIEDLDGYIIDRLAYAKNKGVQDLLVGLINKKLIVPLLKEAEIDIHKKACDLTKHERHHLEHTLKGLTMEITGTHQWNQSQVTAGGIDLKEIESKTLMSKKTENLYITGEVMDIDGDCGGYNLQWAFSTGYVAGVHASGGLNNVS